MYIYFDFGISVKEYESRGKRNDFPEVEQCPHCKGQIRLNRHGFYWRNVIETEQECYKIPICRLKCFSCNFTLSILPTFLLPYFQYSIEIILKKLETILNENKINGYRQLVQFYLKRFFKRLNQIEMFFRDDGFRGALPPDKKARATKLLKMILALGKATFVKRFKSQFLHNFMAN